MEFDNTFDVPLPPSRAWAWLTDIQRIATCLPGAELTEVVDERSYRGRVAVRLGPVALSFAGEATLESLDPDALRARMRCSGSDAKGRGSTRATIDFALAPAATPDATRVTLHSDVTLTGAVAQYGRGAGMIQSVAAQLIGQFAECLRARIDRAERGEDAGEEAAAKPISGLTMMVRALRDGRRGTPEDGAAGG